MADAAKCCSECGESSPLRSYILLRNGERYHRCKNCVFRARRQRAAAAKARAHRQAATGQTAEAVYEEALRQIALGVTTRGGKLRQLPDTTTALRQIAREALKEGKGNA